MKTALYLLAASSAVGAVWWMMKAMNAIPQMVTERATRYIESMGEAADAMLTIAQAPDYGTVFQSNETSAGRKATAINSISPNRSAENLIRIRQQIERGAEPAAISAIAGVHVAAVETVLNEVL